MMTLNKRWKQRSSAMALANTLHDMRVISDQIFDQLIIDIYTKYGDEYYVGDASFDYDPVRVVESDFSSSTPVGGADDTVGIPLAGEEGQER